jgi:hypothetical protein
LVRRTAVLAVLAALAAAASAAAAPATPAAGDPQLVLPPPPASAPVATARAAAAKKTVAGELRRLRDEGLIAPEQYDDVAAKWSQARSSLRKLTGRRRIELGAVLGGVEKLAASGGLTSGRLPIVFEIVARNRDYWTTGPLLSYGARPAIDGTRIVWQYYPGLGLQPQWLGTFGNANAAWKARRNTTLEETLDEALSLASPRAGGIAWESFFSFSGASPVWVSALSQGTGIQALARASQRLQRPDLLEAATAALGIFREPPPTGVRLQTEAGAHYLIYSTNPRLLVLNGFLQSLNGLFDYTQISQNPEGLALFAAGDAEARIEVPKYDTGEWSLYEGTRESDLGYHQLVRQFLEGLCDRTAQPVYCDTAIEFQAQESRPPALLLRTTRATAGAAVPVTFTLSKISTVRLFVQGVPIASARLGRGTHVLRWKGRRKPGEVAVHLDATDLAGNQGTVSGVVELKRPRKQGR